MLNPFPEFLTYALLAPFLLRITLGLILVNLGFLKLKSEAPRWEKTMEALGVGLKNEAVKTLAFIEIISGLMLIVGFYTQIAALAIAILTGIQFFIERREENVIKRNLVFYLLLFVISVSLLFSGAGFFAFDLPL